MWELDCKESWALKNWCFWTVVMEKTLESPLDYQEMQPAHSEGDQPWDFFGRNDVKAETPVLWLPHAKSWLIGKDWWWEGLGAGGEGNDRGWDGWMASPTPWHEFESTAGDGGWQGGLACCDSWGRKESDTTDQLNWTELIQATVSSWSCFCWLCRASPSLAEKNIINLISVLTIWWCPRVESSPVLLEEGVRNDQCVLLAKLC